jgi:RimJ/RimL family protein N-acetyltransferase
VIEHGGLTLRPWTPDDTSWVFHACQDAGIQRWTRVPSPYTAGDAAVFVRGHARPQPEPDAAFFAIARTENDELLGSISFNHIAQSQGEIGYWVVAESRGQGVAPTALAALAGWGFTALSLEGVWLRAARGNRPSQRVAEKVGFNFDHVEADACRDGDAPDDAFVFVLDRARWALAAR